MIKVRKIEIGICWFWLAITWIMAGTVLIKVYPDWWKAYNFWIFVVMNIVAMPAAIVFKENYCDKQRIRRYAKWPWSLSDSKYFKIVNYDILAAFVISIANMFLYIRLDGLTYRWFLNLVLVLGILLFMLNYFDKKYGPKELTRKEQLEERRRKREERLQKQQEATQNGDQESNVTAAVKPSNSNKKNKKKYQTGKKKK